MLSCRGKCTEQILKKNMRFSKHLMQDHFSYLLRVCTRISNSLGLERPGKEKIQKCISPCIKFFFKKNSTKVGMWPFSWNVSLLMMSVRVLRMEKTIKIPLHFVCSFHTCSQLLWIENENAGGNLQLPNEKNSMILLPQLLCSSTRALYVHDRVASLDLKTKMMSKETVQQEIKIPLGTVQR